MVDFFNHSAFQLSHGGGVYFIVWGRLWSTCYYIKQSFYLIILCLKWIPSFKNFIPIYLFHSLQFLHCYAFEFCEEYYVVECEQITFMSMVSIIFHEVIFICIIFRKKKQWFNWYSQKSLGEQIILVQTTQ